MIDDIRYRWRGELKYTRMVKVCGVRFPGRHPADVVSYLRLGEHMTQEQAAKYLGVALTTIRRWQKPEAGVHNMTAKEMEAKRANARRMNERVRNGEIQSGGRKIWYSQFMNGWLKNGK